MHYNGLAVWGNWEYWLCHPERDAYNNDQGKYAAQLDQRRKLLAQKNNSELLNRMDRNTAVVPAENGGTAEFSLFHGCSYACHGNSDFQPEPCECYLYPRDLNIVTRGLFGNPENLETPHFLFGHTHTSGYFVYSVPSMVNMWQFFTYDQKNRPVSYGDSTRRYGINPGSAGIEGKNVPRTALLLDTYEKNFTYLIDEEG